MASTRGKGETSYQKMQNLGAVLACLSVVYIFMPRLPRGLPRVFCILLPCLPILAYVAFSTRSHALRSVLAFSLLWVCPSKLMLRCWDIAPDYPGDGFLYFIATSVTPLRVKGKTHVPLDEDRKPAWASTFRGALFVPLLHFLCFSVTMNVLWYTSSSNWVHSVLFCVLVYHGMGGVVGLFSGFTSLLLGLELHPIFDKPFLASSLSEFWGRRWNRLVSYMLRETVYLPVLYCLSAGRSELLTTMDSSNVETAKGSPQTHANDRTCKEVDPKGEMQDKIDLNSVALARKFQNKGRLPLLARAVAMLASFIVSGLFHELIFYCITQTRATWEVTMFFILHGVATVLEVFLRRKFPSYRILPQPLAIVCTAAFVFSSGVWLFMPPLTRSRADLRLLADCHHVQNVVVDLFSRYKR